MKHLHVFPNDENQKFSIPFVKLIEKYFDASKHQFLMFEHKRKKRGEKINKFIMIPGDIKGALYLLKQINKADKVYFHGLDLRVCSLIVLSLNKGELKKCNWIIWGGDLYRYKIKTYRSYILEIFRRRIIKHIGGIITQLYGDYELARKWYKTNAKYYYSFVYPSNLYKDNSLYQIEEDATKLTIQIGNSACETNNHLQIFEKLKKYKNENMLIICPLSYSGKDDYTSKVIETGYEIFGKDKFIPIKEFLSYEKYMKLLSKVDVAIFNHKRQRGLGNITTLLSFGKKVYIREEVTTWQFCLEHDLTVYSANSNFDNLFEKMDPEVKQKNIANMKCYFSENKLIEDLTNIFNEELD